MPKDRPKGTAVAVLIFLRRNPKLRNRDLSELFGIGVRRIQQIKHKFLVR